MGERGRRRKEGSSALLLSAVSFADAAAADGAGAAVSPAAATDVSSIAPADAASASAASSSDATATAADAATGDVTDSCGTGLAADARRRSRTEGAAAKLLPPLLLEDAVPAGASSSSVG